ncbi:MAG: DUF268 domain-containing protein [Spartobacteria bacterium]|nr:DUF268 domain-containing protein [Spartobacteria bacterium]
MAILAIRKFPRYFRDLRTLKDQSKSAPDGFPLSRLFPCLGDGSANSGTAKGHYFHQDLLVARRIFLNQPKHHVDVGSRVDGFVAHVACFRAIEVFDVRPLASTTPNIHFAQGDFMVPLKNELRDYCDSLSCLHALEHFGLGRYGDPVNFSGHLLGLDNLHGMLQAGGKLYLSVPIGPQRIEFNAHRVFAVAYLLECFRDRFRIDRFSYVDDAGDLHDNVPLADDGVQADFGCHFGCGIFEMTKA